MNLNFLGDFEFVFTYSRVSSTEQSERGSIETQNRRLSSIAPKPTEHFQDVMSGDREDRPGYQSLIKRVREVCGNGGRPLIVITEQSRLSRGGSSTVTELIEELEEIGALIYALDGGVQTVKEAHEWLAIANQAMFNQYFLRQHKRALRRAKAQRRKDEQVIVSRPPTGYLYSREKYLIDEDMYPKMREIVELYLPPPAGKGGSLRECAKLATRLGVKLTNPVAVKKWFLNPTVRGILWYSEGYTKDEKLRGIKYTDKEVYLVGKKHDAIISDEEYQMILARLEDNKAYARCGVFTPRHPYTGLIYCACGEKMHYYNVQYKRPGKETLKYYYYRCLNVECIKGRRRNINEKYLDEECIAILREKGRAIALAVAKEKEKDSFCPKLEALKMELLKEEVEYRKKGREGTLMNIKQIKKEIAELEEGMQPDTSSEDTAKLIERFFGDSPTGGIGWALLSPLEKRAVLRDLISRITFDEDGQVKVILKIEDS